MQRIIRRIYVSLLLIMAWTNVLAYEAAAQGVAASPAFKVPVLFEENVGQVSGPVQFVGRGPGFQVHLSPGVTTYSIASGKEGPQRGHADVVAMHFDGANSVIPMRGQDTLSFESNYFRGSDPTKHYTQVKNHGRVVQSEVYDGIDVHFYSNAEEIEFDFVVRPLAHPDQIVMRFSGTDRPAITLDGDLVIKTASGTLVHRKPVAYQLNAGRKSYVDAAYLLQADGRVAFHLGAYDRQRELIIDPIVTFSYPFWGSVSGVGFDAAGNIFVTGSSGTTNSNPFPAAVGYQPNVAGDADAYVMKLDPTGTSIKYLTYLGGRGGFTNGQYLAVDASGNAYVAGTTSSINFPVTTGSFEPTFNNRVEAYTSFVTKLNPTGSALVYSTFVHGDVAGKSRNFIRAIALDLQGCVYMAGEAKNIATTPTALFPTPTDSYTSSAIIKLNTAGSAAMYATYFPSGPYPYNLDSIAVDGIGNAYLTGSTSTSNFPLVNPLNELTTGVYVSKFNQTGSALIYSTILGAGNYSFVAVNAAGEAAVTGTTTSSTFITTPTAFQREKGFNGTSTTSAFVTKLSSSGNLIFSSYLGGRQGPSGYNYIDQGTNIAIDAAGYVYVGGKTLSSDFPDVDGVGGTITSTSVDETAEFPFITKVSPLGDKLIFSGKFGGRHYSKKIYSLKVDSAGSVLGVGTAGNSGATVLDRSNSNPMTAGALNNLGVDFIFKLSTGKFPTKVRMPSSSAIAGEAITFVADVQSTMLGGTVTFSANDQVIGSVPVENGQAALTTSLARGSHKITAVYSLDNKVSPPVFQIVTSR